MRLEMEEGKLRVSLILFKTQRAHVPKFGNWEGDQNVPYTKYFDDARKGRTGGKMINPNDPLENPEAFSEAASPAHGPAAKTKADPEVRKPKHDRRPSREDGDLRRPMGSPLRYEVMAGKASPQHSYGDKGEPQRRAGRLSGGPDRSIEQSPLHPIHHAKSASRGGVSSPSWERKVSSEGYGTPGRSKMRPGGRGDDVSEKGSEVPKFGDWDPESAEGFTHIFDNVMKEKQTASSKVPVISDESMYRNGHKRASNSDSVSCGCFGLGKR